MSRRAATLKIPSAPDIKDCSDAADAVRLRLMFAHPEFGSAVMDACGGNNSADAYKEPRELFDKIHARLFPAAPRSDNASTPVPRNSALLAALRSIYRDNKSFLPSNGRRAMEARGIAAEIARDAIVAVGEIP